jgi:hypothetical protein
MTKISLHDRCELLFTFDSVDVDAQRNVLYDRSGNGRHADLEGGVSTGRAGPRGESFEFDQTDDKADHPNVSLGNEGTLMTLVRSIDSGTDANQSVNRKDYRNGFDLQEQFDKVRMNYTDVDTGNKIDLNGGSPKWGEWAWYTFVHSYEYGVAVAYVNGDRVDDIDLSGYPSGVSVEFPAVGATPGGSAVLNGRVAFMGIWSRPLTSAERRAVRRMTDRGVAYL